MAPPNVDSMFTLKVDNVPFQIGSDELRDLFSKFGEIGDVYIPRARAPTSRAALPSCALLRSAMLRTQSTAWKDRSSRAETCACSSPSSAALTTRGNFTRVAEVAATAVIVTAAVTAMEEAEATATEEAETAKTAAATMIAGTTAATTIVAKTVRAAALALRTAVTVTVAAQDATAAVRPANAAAHRAAVRRRRVVTKWATETNQDRATGEPPKYQYKQRDQTRTDGFCVFYLLADLWS
ncbi:RNA recognition motif-containing protein [Phytophthora infestans]|uniref:RNA recognition motif-containing protein n=1 Tax=Phytophthora infestans TaxID=4787 RepID=A0A833S5X8_PHYIN|nr:RNA recognition motif-containing protein [Phytophthora infestans]